MTNKLQYISTQETLKSQAKNSKEMAWCVEKRSNIPKSMKIYFLICHFMFGHNLGFENLFLKKYAKSLNVFSAVIALMTFVMLVGHLTTMGNITWHGSKIVECALNFCITMTTKYTVFNLLSDLHALERVTVLEKETFGIIMLMYSLGMMFIKAFFVTVICTIDNDMYCIVNPTIFIFYAICGYTLDVMRDSQMIIRLYIYVYVKNMERSLKQDQDIDRLIERYENIVDCQDKIRHLCDCLTLVEVLVDIPKLLSALWYVLDYLKLKRLWITTTFGWVLTLHLIIQIAIPAVIVQLIESSMEIIRQLLNKWIMFEREPEKLTKMVRVMKYLQRRSLQYKIWGIVPVDLRLPLSLISVCTTYLIVIIQFSHLYD